jgi:hypothetical protein
VLVDQGEPHPLAGVPVEFRGSATEVVVVGIGTFLTWQLGFDPREEHFPGRAAEAGDELGRRVLAARLVRDVIRPAPDPPVDQGVLSCPA